MTTIQTLIRKTFFLMFFSLSSVTAANAGQAEDIADLQSFQLTDAFLTKYQAFQEDVAKDPCKLSPLLIMQRMQSEQVGISEMAAAYDAQPGVHDVLAHNDLTAKTAILGMATLMGAAFQDLAAEHPDLVEDEGPSQDLIKTSDANMAFYRAHKDELQAHQMKLGREQLERNHGKMPACFSTLGEE